MSPIKSKETIKRSYPQEPVCCLSHSPRLARITVPFAPGPVGKLMDVAVGIDRAHGGDRQQKEHTDRKETHDFRQRPVGGSVEESQYDLERS
jgi:hypothetical protein